MRPTQNAVVRHYVESTRCFFYEWFSSIYVCRLAFGSGFGVVFGFATGGSEPVSYFFQFIVDVHQATGARACGRIRRMGTTKYASICHDVKSTRSFAYEYSRAA